jgi:hypothetical protein
MNDLGTTDTKKKKSRDHQISKKPTSAAIFEKKQTFY